MLERAAAGAAKLGELLEQHIEPLEHTGPVRRVGLMAGFDLWRDAKDAERFPTDERRAHRAVLARARGRRDRPAARRHDGADAAAVASRRPARTAGRHRRPRG